MAEVPDDPEELLRRIAADLGYSDLALFEKELGSILWEIRIAVEETLALWDAGNHAAARDRLRASCAMVPGLNRCIMSTDARLVATASSRALRALLVESLEADDNTFVDMLNRLEATLQLVPEL